MHEDEKLKISKHNFTDTTQQKPFSKSIHLPLYVSKICVDWR